MITFQPACSWEVCSQISLRPLSANPAVKKDKSGPKEAPVGGLKVTVLLQDHDADRDLIRVSFLDHLTQMTTKSRADLCEYNRGTSPVLWAVVRYYPCVVA